MLGSSKAAEMLLLNHKLSAYEALKFNFVSEVYAGADQNTQIWPRIQEFAKLPPGSISVTKRLIRRFDENALMAACEFEVDGLRKRFVSEEAQNAIVNFMSRKAKSKL